jgi:hypothetical protein
MFFLLHQVDLGTSIHLTNSLKLGILVFYDFDSLQRPPRMKVLNTTVGAMITLNIEMIEDIIMWGMSASKMTRSIDEGMDPQSLL